MITHGDEEIEEELSALLHLLRHSSAPLEGVAAADDESQVVTTKFRVVIWCMSISPSSRIEQRRHLYIGL
jgi:hypothetical protein